MDGFRTFRKGDQLTAADLNRIAELVTQRFVGGPGIEVRRAGGTIAFSLTSSAVGRRGLALQMSVQSDQGDYLVCRRLDADGNTGSVDFNVLKGYLLRRTPFEGQTVNGVSYTYSANNLRQADAAEDQRITQDYYAGAVVYALEVDVSIDLGGGESARYVAVADGRAWAEVES